MDELEIVLSRSRFCFHLRGHSRLFAVKFWLIQSVDLLYLLKYCTTTYLQCFVTGVRNRAWAKYRNVPDRSETTSNGSLISNPRFRKNLSMRVKPAIYGSRVCEPDLEFRFVVHENSWMCTVVELVFYFRINIVAIRKFEIRIKYFKGIPDQSRFIFEIIGGKRRIRPRTTLKLNF